MSRAAIRRMRHVPSASVSPRYIDVSRRAIRCLAAALAVVAALFVASSARATGGAPAYLAGCQSDADCGEGQMCTAEDGALGDCVAAMDEAGGRGGGDGGSGGAGEASQSLSAAAQCSHRAPGSPADASFFLPLTALAFLAARARARRDQ